jgi:hypothetical protein
MNPDLIFQGEPDEPTKKMIVIQLLDQHPLTANGIGHLEQLVRRNRWGAVCEYSFLIKGARSFRAL